MVIDVAIVVSQFKDSQGGSPVRASM